MVGLNDEGAMGIDIHGGAQCAVQTEKSKAECTDQY